LLRLLGGERGFSLDRRLDRTALGTKPDHRRVANLGHSREAERYWLEHPLPVRDRASRIGRQDNPLAQVDRTVLPLSHKSLCHPEPVNRLAADF
jgi:hypothetical protein